MRIAILANPTSWYRAELERAALARGHQVLALPFADMVANVVTGRSSVWGPTVETEISQVDAVIVRTMPPGTLEQVVFRMNLLSRLESRGVQVFNPPRSIECAVDKYLTTSRLVEAGLPTPATIVCENSDAGLLAFEQLGGDVVVKPVFGAEGRGILRVSDPDLALRTFRTLERLGAILYLQQFVPHAGYDLRVMVLDGRVLAAMRRHSPHDFRTNVSRQARPEAVEITAQERDWALRAAAAVGTRIAGVDILYDRSGAGYVIEVNGVPGWRALARVTACNVANEIIHSLEQHHSPPP
ncbi:MAG: RimK family alpha-L-glutamate ligase [Planctomycetes bacterium]|nr:RimK family alpha-L-glutamate ligase [Planctomycetota bacterium]